MGKKFFKRSDIASILQSNALNAQVTYDERNIGSQDNYIIYERFYSATSSTWADDEIHIEQATVQVNHYHKKKLDNIIELMKDNFKTEPRLLRFKIKEYDFWMTVYQFTIWTDSDW